VINISFVNISLITHSAFEIYRQILLHVLLQETENRNGYFVVDMTSRIRAERSTIWNPVRQEIFFFPKTYIQAPGPTQCLIKLEQEFFPSSERGRDVKLTSHFHLRLRMKFYLYPSFIKSKALRRKTLPFRWETLRKDTASYSTSQGTSIKF
jgi:hypothetical protein